MTMLRVGGLSDVLTPLSDCKQEFVEKMDRRTLSVLYMCGMDFHNAILYCEFMYARIISLYFCLNLVSTLCPTSTATTPRATTPHLYCKGYHAFTTVRLPRLCNYIPATTAQFRVPSQGFDT